MRSELQGELWRRVKPQLLKMGCPKPTFRLQDTYDTHGSCAYVFDTLKQKT